MLEHQTRLGRAEHLVVGVGSHLRSQNPTHREIEASLPPLLADLLSIAGACGKRPVNGVDRNMVLSGRYELEVATERVPAEVFLEPLYDPKNARIKA